MPRAAPRELIGANEATRILHRDRTTVIRWTREGRGGAGTPPELAVVGKLSGKNGAFVFDRAEVLALAERLKAEDRNEAKRLAARDRRRAARRKASA